ncbi:MAG: 5-formyltetrahydrofolate cyclo-ligase [Phycisphaerae bacterium]|nr:5-formyltetrahydrofolate cyclo-ligase [Phycisphaerae bacterium]
MTNDPLISEEKRLLRATMLARLGAMSDAVKLAAGREASRRLLELDEVRDAGVVLFYMAMRSELDPALAMTECLRDGIRVAVPAVDGESGELEAVAIDSLDDRWFARDKWGVRAPKGGERLRVTELDVAVVPGVAFDRMGRRLGRGAGFYDRLLVRLPPRCRTIGLGFECQIVDTVPDELHDRRVAVVASELSVTEVVRRH